MARTTAEFESGPIRPIRVAPLAESDAAEVRRDDLTRLLDDHHGCVLVVAPPGFGKSTLLHQWVRGGDRRWAWLTLEQGDDDPGVLWTSILAALVAVEPGLGDHAEIASRRAGPIFSSGLPSLVGELDRPGEPLVLVIDAVDRLRDPECLSIVEYLLHHRPRRLRVALAARRAIPLHIARLRASGDLLEIGVSDLAMSRDEGARLLRHHLPTLSESAVDSVHTATEGWPAGLRLAAASSARAADPETAAAAFGGANLPVVEYLDEEVLGNLDQRRQEFVIATSVLERLSGPLCDAVTGGTDSSLILSDLEQGGAFIVALDERREWYRPHRLLAEAMRRRLRHDPDRVVRLHRRAAAWHADQGLAAEAIRHHLAAGDTEPAIDTIATLYMDTIEAGDVDTVSAWLDLFPRDLITADARLSVVEAWVMSFLRRPADAQAALDNAARCSYSGPLPDGAGSVEASAALVRAGFPWRDVGQMLAAAERAFGFEDRLESPWRPTVHVLLGFALFFSGDFAGAGPLLESGAALARTSGRPLEELGARCLRARVALETGRLDEAELWAAGAHRLAAAAGLAGTTYGGYADTTMGAVRARQDRFEEAVPLLEQGVGTMQSRVEPLLMAQCLLSLAEVYHATGAASAARSTCAEAEALLDDFTDPGVLGVRQEMVAGAVAADSRDVELSHREHEVLKMLATRRTKREIAGEMYISYNTINTHVRSIYRKLHVSARAEAVAAARRSGLLGPGEGRWRQDRPVTAPGNEVPGAYPPVARHTAEDH